LEALEERLRALREALEGDDRGAVERSLRTAAMARRQLPGRALSAENLAYLRVNITDKPGELGAVTTAASEMAVNIYDIEIAHDIEGVGGTLLLAIDTHAANAFGEALRELGFSVALER
jgi:hypothetical protein